MLSVCVVRLNLFKPKSLSLRMGSISISMKPLNTRYVVQ